MSVIEFQVSTSSFLAAQRTALRSQPVCPARPVAVGLVQIVIDKVEFGNNAIRHNALADFTILHESLIGSGLADLNKGDNAPYCKKISRTIVECTKTVQLPQIS